MDEKLNLFLEPREAVSVLPVENKSLTKATKSELSVMASRALEGVDDGNADALDTLIAAKKGVYVFESIVEGLKNKVKLPQEKEYVKHNAEMREQLTGVSYSFEGCNDPVWVDLKQQSEIINEKLKAREKWLKSFTKPTEVDDEVDEDSGEIIAPARTIYPPVKTGGLSIIVKLK